MNALGQKPLCEQIYAVAFLPELIRLCEPLGELGEGIFHKSVDRFSHQLASVAVRSFGPPVA